MKRSTITLALALFLAPLTVQGKGLYMTPEAFLTETFAPTFTSSQLLIKSLWLTDDIRDKAKQILNHAYPGMRIRYWLPDGRTPQHTAWIFNEVGKTRPITIGISIVDNRIERVRILEFRESRGAEVRMPFFTEQFVGLKLQSSSYELSESVDGITGATLSVRAVKKTARFALYLHQLIVAESLKKSGQTLALQ